jgi:hypothetical protein
MVEQAAHLFQMRSRWRKPARKHQRSTGGGVTQNEPAGIVALTAQPQQNELEFARP